MLEDIHVIHSCEKPSFSKFLIRNTYYFDRNPRFLIEMLGISIETLGFSFQILGISKICDNRIPYVSPNHSATNDFKVSCKKVRKLLYSEIY